MYNEINPNPHKKLVGDCVIRAISQATNKSWGETFLCLCIQGYMMSDLPSSNHVWGTYLKGQGFAREVISDECPDCYTVKDFCRDHPSGIYVLGTGTHAVAVIDGKYCDAWDSGNEQPIYYYTRRVE